MLAAQRQTEAREAWEEKRKAAEQSVGKTAAEQLHQEIYRHLAAGIRDLTPMTPTTFAGLAAKARVAVLLDPHDDYSLNEWEDDLRAAVLRDVARIGGAA